MTAIITNLEVGYDIRTKLNETILKGNVVPSYYLWQDHILNTVTVKQDGTGDYTTITAAYVAITDSSVENQYEIIIYPGVYDSETQGLQPPPFTHTKAKFQGSVKVVQSVNDGNPSTHVSVFDPVYSCKISGLHILSETSALYAMHGQPDDLGAVQKISHCIIENSDGGNTLSGDAKGQTMIFESCRFLTTATAGQKWSTRMHTVPTRDVDWNMDLQFLNCSISGGLGLNSYGGSGRSICTIVNCEIDSIYGTHLNENESTDLNDYPANNFEWEIRGGGNKAPIILNSTSNGEALMLTTTNVDEQIVISGTAVGVLFGEYKTIVGDGRIEGKIIGYGDVRDVKNGYLLPNTLDIVQMWKRLGDCSVVNKTLTVTVGGVPETVTFTDDYETLETAEAAIIAFVNAGLTVAVLSKFNAYNTHDNIHIANKKRVWCNTAGGILKNEIVYAVDNFGTLVAQEAVYQDVTGIALHDAAEGEPLEIWTGIHFVLNGDGEYGIGATNLLSGSATNKIGYVRSNFFHPYY